MGLNYSPAKTGPGYGYHGAKDAAPNYSNATGGTGFASGVSPVGIPASGMTSQFQSNPSNYAPASSSGGGYSAPKQLSSLTDEAARGEFGMSLSDLLKSNTSAAEQARQAQLGQANSQYDYNAEQLKNQLSGLDSQKQSGFNEIDTGLQGLLSQAGTSRESAQTNADQQVRQAGGIAKSTQQQNRNVLRSLGIINSSAAGELLTKPMNEFGQQRAQVQQQLGQRFKELDNYMDQSAKEAQNKKDSLLANYTQVFNNIQSDLRFNDRQRLDAVNQVNAAASQHLADIQTQMLNFQNQVTLQKQQFAMSMAQMGQYQDPTISSDYNLQNLLTNAGTGTKTAAIYQDPLKKKA